MLINRASCSVFRAALGHESAGVVNGPGRGLLVRTWAAATGGACSGPVSAAAESTLASPLGLAGGLLKRQSEELEQMSSRSTT